MNQVDLARLERATEAARKSPRLRANDNLHAMDDAIHRLLNATEPGTYVQPHRHSAPPKIETLSVVRGRGAILVFDDAGNAIETSVLGPDGPIFVAEIPAGAWHTLVAIEPGTVWFEVKPGPYAPPLPEDVAQWAPAPGTAECARFVERWTKLARGGR
jgi:cupin fold WbuC family metalloprotein